MKRYIKTALITSLVMLLLMGAAGIFIGKAYLKRQDEEKLRTEEEMDMNLYGSSQLEIDESSVYELKLSGQEKNVETVSFKNAAEVYNVEKSAGVKEELEHMKKKNSYSADTPLWVYNPFGTNKLSMYVYFKTPEAYSAKYTIHIDDKEIPDFTRNCYNENGTLLKEHEYQITGLVPGVKNYIVLSLYDKKGELKKQAVYSITPKTPSDAPQVKLSNVEGKSSEKLSTGLYVFLGEDIYLYDNSGVLRGMLPLQNSHAVNFMLLEGQMLYNYSSSGFAAVDSFGQVKKVYKLNGYKIANDFTYDGYGNLLVLASAEKAGTKADRIVSVNLRSGTQTEAVNFAELLPKMKKKASKGSGEKLNWLNLNSIAMTGSDSVVVSSKELSSIIKVNSINSAKPSIGYILAQDTVWNGSGYEELLYTKTVSEEGDKLFKSQFGQSSLEIVKDALSEQYSILMLNHNYGNSSTRKDIKWSETEGVGTAKKAASASKYYRYDIDEAAQTYMLTDSFNVPYSKEGSLYSYETHFVVSGAKEGFVNEYDKDGKLIRGLTYKEKSSPYKVQKQSMKEFWYR